MINNFSCFPKDLIAAFGPCIRKCCYEVDRGFGRIFKEVEFRNGKYYLDLVKNNFNQLVKLGVEKRNIFDSGICSSCSNGKFFSYRREGESAGRTLELLMIKGEK